MSDMFHLAEKQLSKKIFYNISQNFEVKWNEKNLTPQNNWRLGMWCIKDNNCFSQPRWARMVICPSIGFIFAMWLLKQQNVAVITMCQMQV